jgi:hypothetical protein
MDDEREAKVAAGALDVQEEVRRILAVVQDAQAVNAVEIQRLEFDRIQADLNELRKAQFEAKVMQDDILAAHRPLGGRPSERQALDRCSRAYARDEITMEQYEEDVELVLRGEQPVHCRMPYEGKGVVAEYRLQGVIFFAGLIVTCLVVALSIAVGIVHP